MDATAVRLRRRIPPSRPPSWFVAAPARVDGGASTSVTGRTCIDSFGRCQAAAWPTVLRLNGSPSDGFPPQATSCGLAHHRVHVKPAGGPSTRRPAPTPRTRRRRPRSGAPSSRCHSRGWRRRRRLVLGGDLPSEHALRLLARDADEGRLPALGGCGLGHLALTL